MHAQRTKRIIIAVAGFLLIQALPSSGENWFLPSAWDQSGVCHNDADGDAMRDDWLPLVTDPAEWDSVRDRIEVFKIFYNMLRNHPLSDLCVVLHDPPNPPTAPTEMPLTNLELELLVDALQTGDDPLAVGFEVAGIRLGDPTLPNLPEDYCDWVHDDPSGVPNIEGVGACQADKDIMVLNRWEDANGTVDVLNLDHAMGNNWCREDPPYAVPNSCSIPWQDLVREMADYLAAMHLEYPNARLGIYEGPALFHVVGPDGTYPARGPAEDEPTFEEFIDELLDQIADRRLLPGLENLYLNHYDIDHASHAVYADGGFDGTWDFGRVTLVEKKLCSRDVTVGLLAHPGNGFMGPRSTDPDANDNAYGTAMRYLAEYRLADGDADNLVMGMWHTHPYVTGPEEAPSSIMNLARDLLGLDEHLLRTYRSDEFDDSATTAALWQLEGLFSVSDGRLELENETGAQLAALNAPAALDSVIASFTVQLGGAWAGLQLRKSTAADLPWQSGYLVLIRADGDGGEVQVRRADPGSPMVLLDATPFSPNPTVDDVEVRVELIDDHFRVYVNDVIELDFDIPPGDLIAPGADLAGLITFGGPASFERFDIAQALSPSFEDTFDDGCGGWWVEGCGSGSNGWQVVGSPGAERLEAPSVANLKLQTLKTSELPHLPEYPSSFELSARVVPHANASNWAGVFLRHSGPSFWSSGYLVFLKSNGEVGLRIPGRTFPTKSIAIDPVAGADLTVRVVGDRITVSVDHCQVFDEIDDVFTAGDLGLASFRTNNSGASASFDDVELTILPD
ncbi:MAG: hypothetical protein GY720_13665 [bacterium]|nr:hypothetical protein [bacterium]